MSLSPEEDANGRDPPSRCYGAARMDDGAELDHFITQVKAHAWLHLRAT
jgi:hypothetical protein